MECPICFDTFNDAAKRPIRTFCRCHQTLCMECLEKLLGNFTYCPWDRARWSGRNLIGKFMSSTPENYLQTLAAQARANSAAAPASRPLCCPSSSSSPVSLISTPITPPVSEPSAAGIAASVPEVSSAASSISASDSSSFSSSSSALHIPAGLASPGRNSSLDDLCGLDWDIEEQERLFAKLEREKRNRHHAPLVSGPHEAPRKRTKMDLLRYIVLDLSNDSPTTVKPRKYPDAQKRLPKQPAAAPPTITRCLQSLGSATRPAARQPESSPAPPSWSCGRCSFSNFPLLLFCEMCEAPRHCSSAENRSSAGAAVL